MYVLGGESIQYPEQNRIRSQYGKEIQENMTMNEQYMTKEQCKNVKTDPRIWEHIPLANINTADSGSVRNSTPTPHRLPVSQAHWPWKYLQRKEMIHQPSGPQGHGKRGGHIIQDGME